jgi:hypothetical protein
VSVTVRGDHATLERGFDYDNGDAVALVVVQQPAAVHSLGSVLSPAPIVKVAFAAYLHSRTCISPHSHLPLQSNLHTTALELA